ncbi:MAG: bile acid:sodium symporter family protein [Arenicella sp.]|nr:bile acid:sodium symporter family protein [Arenicella sp.]
MGALYVEYEYFIAAFQLAFAMLGMGATLTVGDFKDVLREPQAVSSGTLVQLALVPLVAYLFIGLTGIAGGIAVGIALIAAIPGGTTSNIFTYFAKGSIPLSISITGITTLACLFTTPFILGLLITEYLPAGFAMPTGQIVTDIALTLLLPLAIGMLILRVLRNSAMWVSKWSIRLSLFGILLIIIGSSSAGRLDIDAFGIYNMLLVCAFVLVLLIASYSMTRLLNLSVTDRTAIEMEVVVRNVNLGVLIKASIFPVVVGGANQIGDTVLFTVLLYGAVQMLVAAALIFTRRRSAEGPLMPN